MKNILITIFIVSKKVTLKKNSNKNNYLELRSLNLRIRTKKTNNCNTNLTFFNNCRNFILTCYIIIWRMLTTFAAWFGIVWTWRFSHVIAILSAWRLNTEIGDPLFILFIWWMRLIILNCNLSWHKSTLLHCATWKEKNYGITRS